MSLKPWAELSVAERRKFRIRAIRNPGKLYESIRSQAENTNTASFTGSGEQMVEEDGDF